MREGTGVDWGARKRARRAVRRRSGARPAGGGCARAPGVRPGAGRARGAPAPCGGRGGPGSVRAGRAVAGTRLGRGAMRGSPDWPLRPLLSRGAAARAWTPAARHRAFRLPTTGLGPPRPWGAGPGLPGRGAGLARLLGLWARLPGAPRVPRAALPGGPAVAARAGDEAWRRGPATPRDDSRLRPAAPGRSEARKLLGLAYPERRRLAGRAPRPPSALPAGTACGARSRGGREGTPRGRHRAQGRGGLVPGHFDPEVPVGALASPENCRALQRSWGPGGGIRFVSVVSRATLSQGSTRSRGPALCGSGARGCPYSQEEPGFPRLFFVKLTLAVNVLFCIMLLC